MVAWRQVVGRNLLPARVGYALALPGARLRGGGTAHAGEGIGRGTGGAGGSAHGSAGADTSGEPQEPTPGKMPMQQIDPNGAEPTRFFTPQRVLFVPDERSGLLFVFRVFDRVSYAILLNTTDPVFVGDYVRNP